MGLFDDAIAEASNLIKAKKKPVQGDVAQDLSPLREGRRAIATMPEEPRGALDLVGVGLKRGVISTIPKAEGQAMQFFSEPGKPIYERGKQIAEAADIYARMPENRPPSEKEEATHPVGSFFSQGAEQVPLSMVGMVPGVGDAIFYGSQGQQSYETTKKQLLSQGVPEQEAEQRARTAGHKSGAIEAGGERLASIFGGKLLGVFGKGIGKGALTAEGVLRKIAKPQYIKEFGKDFLETLAAETSTEFTQNVGERYVEQQAGATEGPSLYESGKQAVAPTLAMTMLLAPLGIPARMAQSGKGKAMIKALAEPNESMEKRASAAEVVAQAIEKVDPEASNNWRQNAAFSIDRDLPITLDPSNLRPVIEKIRANGPDFTLQGQPYDQPEEAQNVGPIQGEQPLPLAPPSNLPMVAPESRPAVPAAEDRVDASYGPGDPNYQIYGFPPAVPRGPISRAIQSLTAIPANATPISKAAQHALPVPAVQEALPPPETEPNEQISDIARMPLSLPAGAETEAGRSIKRIEQSLKDNGISPDNPAYQKILEEHRHTAREYDLVTGYQPGDYLDRTIKRVKKIGGEASYGALDLRNLGGLNDHFGGEEKANAALGKIAGIIKSTVDSVIDKHAQWFRKGGDEFSVVAEGVSQKTLDAALRKASDAVDEYAAEHGLSDIVHPKGKEKGVGIYYGTSDFTPKTARETITAAEDRLYKQKKEAQEVTNGKETSTTQSNEVSQAYSQSAEQQAIQPETETAADAAQGNAAVNADETGNAAGPVSGENAETVKKVQAITENTDRLLKDGGYMVAIQPKSEKGEANLYGKGYRPYTWDEATNALKEHGSGVWAKKPEEKKPVRFTVKKAEIVPTPEGSVQAVPIPGEKTIEVTPEIKKPVAPAKEVITPEVKPDLVGGIDLNIIPDDLMVLVEEVIAETGKTYKNKVNARTALRENNTDIERSKALLECLRS